MGQLCRGEEQNSNLWHPLKKLAVVGHARNPTTVYGAHRLPAQSRQAQQYNPRDSCGGLTRQGSCSLQQGGADPRVHRNGKDLRGDVCYLL